MSVENYGSYQLLKRLATGGMAQIYLARQFGPEGFEKLLVVKRILPHLAENEDFVRMFLDEARIAARLNHPNIVQIFNLGAQSDSYFIAMEYIHGEDVRRIWKRAEQLSKDFPVALVCRVIMDACAGLDYAHKKTDAAGRPLGIVHRDVSPQNILVTYDGNVKVVDFGIAKAADQATETRSGVLKGKYSYMSPEQAAGKRVDQRSDIFALGVVLHELLTGTRLFKRATDVQTLNAVTECNVPPPSELVEDLPPDIDAIVLKALARDPHDRFQHAVELQLALANWLLEHQLPSSSLHLAAFMQDLYADRLAAEAKKGQVILEGEEERRRRYPKTGQAVVPETGAPRIPTGLAGVRSDLTAAMRTGHTSGTGSRKRVLPAPRPPPAPALARPAEEEADDDPTHFADPSEVGGNSNASTVSGDQPAPPPRTPWLQPRHARVLGVLLLASFVALMAGVGAGYVYLRWRRPALPAAVVHLLTRPPGATVTFNGHGLGEKTPCLLPAVPEGNYPLVLRAPGYLEYRATVLIPETGTLTLPVFELERDPAQRAAETVAQTPVPKVQVATTVAAKEVRVTFRTQPPGAELFLDGERLGPAPQSLSAEVGASRVVRASLKGYLDLERQVRVGEKSEQTEWLRLEKVRPARPTGQGSGGVANVTPRPERGLGKVRFAVTPWADVSCGVHRFGQTPFPDQQLPAGTYDCTFVNPELGTRVERVEIRANTLAKVTVRF